MRLLRYLRRNIKDRIYDLAGVYSHLSSEAYISEIESRGCRVGEGTEFFGENNVDLGYAHLITIGQNCVITDKVRILAHARDDLILSRIFENAPDQRKRGAVDIGDNVFLGERSIILPDVEIGDDVIIGAGSIVTSDIPSRSVAAGVPCQVKCSLKEYRDNRVLTEGSEIKMAIRCCKNRNVSVSEELTNYTDS